MVWELIVVVALVSLLAASINDLRTREVPDWVSYATIASGLGINFIGSLASADPSFVVSSILGFGIAWGLGAALFYTGQWGGGDSKILMGLGALFGFRGDVLAFESSFVMNLIVAGGMYGLVWMLVLGLMNLRKSWKAAKVVHKEQRYVAVAAVIGAVFCMAASVMLWDSWFWFPALFAGFLILLTYGLFIGLKAVERVCFLQLVPAHSLVEGDWIVQDVKVRGEYVCGPKDLGVSRKQIALLKKHGVKQVLVRSGIPFVPTFLIALVATLSVGNVLMVILL